MLELERNRSIEFWFDDAYSFYLVKPISPTLQHCPVVSSHALVHGMKYLLFASFLDVCIANKACF